MKKIFSIILSLLIFTSVSYASSNTYTLKDKYGRKVSTYKTTGNTTIERNRYGQKTATYKRSSNGTITKYDRYGRKVGTIKENWFFIKLNNFDWYKYI